MIKKLSTLNKYLVWGFLGAHAHKPEIYANSIDGFVPYIVDKRSFFFATEEEVIIVCVDITSAHSEELADEEKFGKELPLYFSAHDHRISPVYRLSQALSLFSQSLDSACVKSPRIRGVLLTTGTIINHDDMQEQWRKMGIMVFHKMPNVIRHNFTIDTHENLPMAKWFNIFKEYCQRPQFINMIHDYNHINADDTEDDDDGDEEDHVFDDFEDKLIDLDLPKGEFTLSQNNTVKVDILNPIKNPCKELDKLVGCNDIKAQINALITLNRYNQMMLRINPKGKQHELSLHSVFFGRPGTGKTTVCKIYGSLLREAGMLSKGHVVCCNRSTFIGSNWGDEDKAVRHIVDLAKGGVLMVDEAYLLNSNHPNDPGKLVIPLLMDILANEDMRDIAIILCGYKDEMLRLIDLNPGLDSRFPNRFDFPDFSIEDLLEITRRRIKEYGYRFTRSAWQKYREIVAKSYEGRDVKTWGNARFIANLLEQIYLRHANRCVRMKSPDCKHLLCITTADVEYVGYSKTKRKIGF